MDQWTLHLPKLYPKQRAAIFSPLRYSVIEASTKSGKTIGCITWLLAEAWQTGKEGRNYWWVAPTFPVAKIAYRRLRRMMLRVDRTKTIWDSNDSELTISIKLNGTIIAFKGSDNPDSLYGEDVYAAVIDEATRCKEEAWWAIRSTLTHTRGKIRIIGNVKGRKNWAYNLARKAEQGDSAMSYHKLTAWDAVEAGVLAREEIEDAKRLLPESVFRELYLAEPSDDGGNPFGLAHIAACWRDAPLTGEVSAWGVDLAKSHDWTWIIGLNKQGGVVVSERWQTDWKQTRERLNRMIGEHPALIDSTGVGDPIVEDLITLRPQVEGYNFTQKSKQQIMEGLASGIQSSGVAYADERLRKELESFEYEYTRTGVRYTAPEGLHDDGVCALALAYRKLTMTGEYLPFTINVPNQPKVNPRMAVLMDAGWR